MKNVNHRIVIALLLVFQGIVVSAVPRPEARSLAAEGAILSLPQGKVGMEYEFQFQTEGGLAPLNWKVIEGTLPPGIKLESSGKLHGVPTTSQLDAYRFVVEVADSSPTPQKVTQTISLMIQAALLRVVTTPSTLKIGTSQAATPPKGILKRDEDFCENSPADTIHSTLTVHVKVKGTGYPVSYAHVQLLQLVPDSDPPEYRPIETGFCCKDADGKRRKCNTGFQEPAVIQIYDITGPIKIAVQKDLYYPYVLADVIPTDKGNKVVTVELTPRDDEYYRAVLGAEQTGVSANGSQQNIFLNLFTSRPLIRKPFYTEPGKTNCLKEENRPTASNKEDFTCTPPKQRIWGDFRITSVPQPKQNLFQALNGSLGSTLNGSIGKINDLEIGFSFLGGYQLKLTRGSIAGNRFDFSLIVGGGAAAVPAPDKNVTIFKKPATEDSQRLELLKAKIEKIAGIKRDVIDKYDNIAFVTRGRDRFFRNYFSGFRFETHYGDTTPVRPSGQFDITFGQDESVTGGRLRGMVLRLDGFFPLPLGKGNLVYLFGTAQMGLTRAHLDDTLLLPLADTTQTLTSPNTLIVPIPAANRDVYRFGVGVNLLQIFTGKPNN